VADAGVLVGALADDVRRRVFAAVELGASSPERVAEATALAHGDVAKALGKLLDLGLVTVVDRQLRIDPVVLRDAARNARARPPRTEHEGLPLEVRKVLDVFVVDGRLTSIPTVHSKRRVVLDWLAQEFEPGRRYTEAMVNLTLGQRHADTAALRRYLVDEGFLSREAGEYWRSGGSTTP
jgi:hypothetical protein